MIKQWPLAALLCAGLSTPAGAITQTAVNPVDYGASTASADNSTAFNNAVQDAISKGVPMVIPAGTWKLQHPFEIYEGAIVQGLTSRTILKSNTTSAIPLLLAMHTNPVGSGGVIGSPTGVDVSNLTFDMNGNPGVAVLAESVLAPTLRRINFINVASAHSQAAGQGTVSGSVLTISSVSSGTFHVGDRISDAYDKIKSDTYISSLGTGTGGVGTYNLNKSQPTISSAETVSAGGWTWTGDGSSWVLPNAGIAIIGLSAEGTPPGPYYPHIIDPMGGVRSTEQITGDVGIYLSSTETLTRPHSHYISGGYVSGFNVGIEIVQGSQGTVVDPDVSGNNIGLSVGNGDVNVFNTRIYNLYCEKENTTCVHTGGHSMATYFDGMSSLYDTVYPMLVDANGTSDNRSVTAVYENKANNSHWFGMISPQVQDYEVGHIWPQGDGSNTETVFGGHAMNYNCQLLGGNFPAVYNTPVNTWCDFSLYGNDGTNATDSRKGAFVRMYTGSNWSTTNYESGIKFNYVPTGATAPRPGLDIRSSDGAVIIPSASGTDASRGVAASLVMSEGPIYPMQYTVAGLPACNANRKGGIMLVTDANGPTFNAVLAGGGTSPVMGVCDGTNWRAH